MAGRFVANCVKGSFPGSINRKQGQGLFWQSQALKRYRGQENTYDDTIKATVVGVVKDFNVPTDFVFKEFISRATIEKTGLKNHWNWEEWGSINSSSQMFVKLKKGTKPAANRKATGGYA